MDDLKVGILVWIINFEMNWLKIKPDINRAELEFQPNRNISTDVDIKELRMLQLTVLSLVIIVVVDLLTRDDIYPLYL